MKKEVVSLFTLRNIMNCIYIVKVEVIHGPQFVFKNYGSSGENATRYSACLGGPKKKHLLTL
jgi:hypothetical protein